jgi:GXWXG protein
VTAEEIAMGDELARKKFTEFKERTGAIDDAELDDYSASLPQATVYGMLGEWKGGEFVTDHQMNGQLEKARWFGKTFNSPADVQPLVCLDDDDNRFSNVKMGKGEASLWLEDFRGEVTAAMVY